MKVQNYYSMSPDEIEKALDTIRMWLWNFPHHQERAKALFALDVAVSAKELKKESEHDEFFASLQAMLEHL